MVLMYAYEYVYMKQICIYIIYYWEETKPAHVQFFYTTYKQKHQKLIYTKFHNWKISFLILPKLYCKDFRVGIHKVKMPLQTPHCQTLTPPTINVVSKSFQQNLI